MQYLLADPERAERIANNSASVFRDRYLTPAAQACYWREMIRAWRLASFEPKKWEAAKGFGEAGDITRTAMKPRGTPYETFVCVNPWLDTRVSMLTGLLLG